MLQTLQSKGHEGRRHNDRHTGCQVRCSVLVFHPCGRCQRNVLTFGTLQPMSCCFFLRWVYILLKLYSLSTLEWNVFFPERTSFAFLENIYASANYMLFLESKLQGEAQSANLCAWCEGSTSRFKIWCAEIASPRPCMLTILAVTISVSLKMQL